MYKVLVVDDEKDIVELLVYNLEKAGYQVKSATNGKEAVEKAQTFLPDLILLDIMLPGMDGIETAYRIRQLSALKGSYILFLTAREDEYTQVAAFERGGDDYITKPIKPRALMSRIGAFLKRDHKEDSTQEHLVVGELVINQKSFTVTCKGKKLVLPKKEFELLSFLAHHPNILFRREELLETIWDREVSVLARTVDVHIRKIREKIGEDYIKTTNGVGYMFETPASSN